MLEYIKKIIIEHFSLRFGSNIHGYTFLLLITIANGCVYFSKQKFAHEMMLIKFVSIQKIKQSVCSVTQLNRFTSKFLTTRKRLMQVFAELL